MDSSRSETAYQLERAPGHLEGSTPISITWTTHSHLLRQQHNYRLHQQLWWHEISRSHATSPAYMEILSHDPHPRTAHLRAFSVQSGGRTIATIDDSARMENHAYILQPLGSQMGTTSGRSIRTSHEHAASEICDLAMGSSRVSNGCYEYQLATSGPDIHMPTMEFDISHIGQTTTGTHIRDNHHPLVAVRDLVSNDPTDDYD